MNAVQYINLRSAIAKNTKNQEIVFIKYLEHKNIRLIKQMIYNKQLEYTQKPANHLIHYIQCFRISIMFSVLMNLSQINFFDKFLIDYSERVEKDLYLYLATIKNKQMISIYLQEGGLKIDHKEIFQLYLSFKSLKYNLIQLLFNIIMVKNTEESIQTSQPTRKFELYKRLKQISIKKINEKGFSEQKKDIKNKNRNLIIGVYSKETNTFYEIILNQEDLEREKILKDLQSNDTDQTYSSNQSV